MILSRSQGASFWSIKTWHCLKQRPEITYKSVVNSPLGRPFKETEGLCRVEGIGNRAIGFRVNPAPSNGYHKGLLQVCILQPISRCYSCRGD